MIEKSKQVPWIYFQIPEKVIDYSEKAIYLKF